MRGSPSVSWEATCASNRALQARQPCFRGKNKAWTQTQKFTVLKANSDPAVAVPFMAFCPLVRSITTCWSTVLQAGYPLILPNELLGGTLCPRNLAASSNCSISGHSFQRGQKQGRKKTRKIMRGISRTNVLILCFSGLFTLTGAQHNESCARRLGGSCNGGTATSVPVDVTTILPSTLAGMDPDHIMLGSFHQGASSTKPASFAPASQDPLMAPPSAWARRKRAESKPPSSSNTLTSGVASILSPGLLSSSNGAGDDLGLF